MRTMKRSSCESGSGYVRGHHGEGRGQRVRGAVQGHLALGHGLQQRGLRARRGAVQLIRQHELTEEGTGTELEGGRLRVEDLGAEDVGRHQVRGELDAGEAQATRPGQGLRECRLAHTRHVLQEEVAPGHQARHDELGLGLLALDRATQLGGDPFHRRMR
jgi:hypothetical protein